MEEVILNNIDNENAIFVFPTQVTAVMWAEKLLLSSGIQAVAMERFIAWDSFKSSAIRSVKHHKSSIPSAVRKLFSQKILEKNLHRVKEGKPLFTSLIPPSYAQYGMSFSDWITSLLPQLSSWYEKASHIQEDDEDRDLKVLMHEYEVFLDEHHLFEPAWEKPPFNDNGYRYFLFFPTILQDYMAYENILLQSPNITLIDVPSKQAYSKELKVVFYKNSREEIRKTALYIRELREIHNIPYTSIALHVPGLDELYQYITREFSLRGIPHQLRAGKTLSTYPSGTLFSLIKACASDSFSFLSLKHLLSNTAFPWRLDIKHSIDVFLQYGIDNNCLVSYESEGHFVDIWEKTLVSVPHGFVSSFYYTLKDAILRFTLSKSFSDLRQAYFYFKHIFFDNDAFSEEADLVLSRCISELMNLCSFEKEFSDCIPSDPLSFFCHHLDSCEYLAQTKLTGVHIFPYRTAAGSPFDYSIVINAGQKQISVMYKPLDFLSQNKRTMLKIEETNVSDQFAVLYSFSKPRFTCSAKTFSGWSLPHSVFEVLEDSLTHYDPFTIEKSIFDSVQKKEPHPAKFLHTVQKEGFLKWYNPLPPSREAITLDPVSYEKLISRLKDENTQKLKISPTVLKDYFTCPLFFLYNNIYELTPISLKADLLDEVFLGILYHAILHRFFQSYKNKQIPAGAATLNSKTAETLRNAVREVIDSFPSSCFKHELISDLTVQVVKAQEASLYKRLSSLLQIFFQFFGTTTLLSSEEEIILEQDKYILKGIVDLVLKTEDGIWLLDFKTSATPTKNDCVSFGNTPLLDFQPAMYTRLYEEKHQTLVYGMGFFSIHKLTFKPMFGKAVNILTNRTSPYRINDRICRISDTTSNTDFDFSASLSMLEQYIDLFYNNSMQNTLSLSEGIPYETCASCMYKQICRTTFIVDGDKTAAKSKMRSFSYDR